MATLSASDFQAPPRQNPTGLQVARTTVSGASLSTGDVILGPKIPHGAFVVDGYISGVAGVAGSVITVRAGLQSLSSDLFMSTKSISATAVLQRFDRGELPTQVSVSDDAANQYRHMTCTCVAGGSITGSYSIQMVVWYAMPGAI